MAHAALLSKQLRKTQVAIERISDRRSCISVGQYHDASIQGAWQSPYLEHCRCSVGDRIGSVSLWRQKSAWNTHCTMRRWLALLESFGASGQIRYVIVILDAHHPTTSIHFCAKLVGAASGWFTCRPHFCHLQACSAKLLNEKSKAVNGAIYRLGCRPSATQ